MQFALHRAPLHQCCAKANYGFLEAALQEPRKAVPILRRMSTPKPLSPAASLAEPSVYSRMSVGCWLASDSMSDQGFASWNAWAVAEWNSKVSHFGVNHAVSHGLKKAPILDHSRGNLTVLAVMSKCGGRRQSARASTAVSASSRISSSASRCPVVGSDFGL